jgi:putative addiction module component (TIGR02574 family)
MSSFPPSTDFERLSTAEKILRLQEAWDRIAENPDNVEVTEAQKDALDKRLEAMERSPEEGASWEDTKDQIRKSR